MQNPSNVWGDDVVSSRFAEVQLDPSSVDDLSLVTRIVLSYSRNFKDKPKEGIWHSIGEKLQPVDEVLQSQNIEAVTALLRDPASSNLFWGFDGLVKELLVSRENPDLVEESRKNLSRSLLRFAEMLGVVRIYDPESPTQNVPPQITPDQVLDTVDKFLGVQIELPNIYPREGGLSTSRGVLSYRAAQALYQITRIRTILGTIKGKRILEIGAGLGRTAHFGILCGAKQYDIVDIPLTAVSQGYFLGRTLGSDMVRLHGEPMGGLLHKKVHLLTAEEFLKSNAQYDIIINVDSLTEMPEDISVSYVEKIIRTTGIFLSINHEVNSTTVRELFERVHGIIPLRYLYWVRIGYAEEIYRSKNASLKSHLLWTLGRISSRLPARVKSGISKLLPTPVKNLLKKVIK